MTRPHPVNTKQAINPTNHESTVELAGSRFASDRLHFGSRAFWKGNMGTSGGSRQALALHDGRTSAWKLHYVPAVGLAVALSKNNLGRMMFLANTLQIISSKTFLGGYFKGKREQELLVIILFCFFVRWPVCMKGLSFEGNIINMYCKMQHWDSSEGNLS